MLDAPASLVQAFKAKGHKVICYFSAGTWEKWRADADQFPAAALGRTVGGWPNERWLNTSNPEVRDIMVARMKVGQAKGCDGVDPDNIDGYENNTGFDITEDQAVDYVQFLQRTANSLGMAAGLKNGGDIIPRVINGSAWSVNEQCVQYNECEPYQAFIKQNKPVFHLEYTKKAPAPKSFVKKSCDDPQAKGFSTLVKHLSLNQWTTTCK
ncbi:glycoside hydrolase superfamily [Neohortaea acidophila]|uniref:alpha-galactosidase n=1 Tax=Neohortaea acidophila TaxID=245834 RepID=A0A6A6PW00_9PEZI|nr:glycoside hydrolase superfamily [Neohortaea acidophila]KAF2484212.1 glycoside hydrolase superfamily [Neohortaea acidophila]